MSSFIVSEEHIHALVSIALVGVAEAKTIDGAWHSLSFGNPGRLAHLSQANCLGDMLWREKHLSVAARYPSEGIVYDAPFVYSGSVAGQYWPVVSALKLLKCFEYQSSDHDGWDTSQAKRFCEHLKDRLIDSLPGYDEAPWGV